MIKANVKYVFVTFLILMAAGVLLVHGQESTEQVINNVYGTAVNGCTVASDIDDGDQDLIGPLTAGKLYVVFCYDSSTFAGLACRVKQGTSSVNASTGEGADGEGELLFAGEKKAIYISNTYKYLSFEPLADGTTQVGVACRQN